METKKIKAQYLILFFIVILSAFFRFYRLRDYLIFLGDQGRDVLVVKKMLLDGKFTLLGPVASVGGFYLGPLYYYLMAPFLLLSNFDPLGPAFLPVILGVVTTIILFFYLKNKMSVQTALIASFLYAVSPVLVRFNRFSWNPNVAPFFSLIFFIFFEKFIESKNKWHGALCGFLLGCLFQIHYLSFIFLPVIFIIIFFSLRARLTLFLKSTGVLLSGTVVGWFPFILYEIRHSLQNFNGLFEFIARKDGANVGFDPTRYFKTIFENFNLIFQNLFNLPPLTNIIIFCIFIVSIWQNRKSFLIKFTCLSWWIISLYKGRMGEHYLNILYVFFLIIFAQILSCFFKSVKSSLIGFGLLAILFYVSSLAYPFWRPPNYQLDQTIDISRHLFNKYIKDQKFNFALVTQTNSDHAYRYFFDLWGDPPIEIVNDVIDPQRKTVTDKLIVLCEPLIGICPDPRGYNLWEIASFGRAEIRAQENYGVYTIYELKHVK